MGRSASGRQALTMGQYGHGVDPIIKRLQQLGTCISLATAQAVTKLAGDFTATLLSDLRAPVKSEKLLLIAKVVHAHLSLEEQVDEQLEEQVNEQLDKQLESDFVWSRDSALVYLEHQPFDTIMAAYSAFKASLNEPHQQQQKAELGSYLEEMLHSELQAIGAQLCSSQPQQTPGGVGVRPRVAYGA